jgi:hypothetical protein
MLLGIDHLVIAVKSVETASKDYTALGFTVVPGGRHTGIAWLAARGPSPYAATFTSRAGRPGALDPAKTHGARLALA